MSTATEASARAADSPAVAEVPDAVSPPPGQPRFGLMDSVRGLAALGVLLAHVSIFSQEVRYHWWGVVPGNLFIGVPIFFVLSGFLIYRPFFNTELTAARQLRIRDYARRRVLRIVPAYWLALTVLAIYPGLSGVFGSQWWRYYGFLQFYDRNASLGGMGVAWTLCIEVAFYLLLPVYAGLTRWAARRFDAAGKVRFQLALLALLGAGSIILRVVDQDEVMQNSLLTHFYWFAVGMALAVASVAVQGRGMKSRAIDWLSARPGTCWLAAAAVYLVMCSILSSAPQHLLYSVFQSFWLYLLSGVIAALIVLPAVFGEPAVGVAQARVALTLARVARPDLLRAVSVARDDRADVDQQGRRHGVVAGADHHADVDDRVRGDELLPRRAPDPPLQGPQIALAPDRPDRKPSSPPASASSGADRQ